LDRQCAITMLGSFFGPQRQGRKRWAQPLRRGAQRQSVEASLSSTEIRLSIRAVECKKGQE